MRLLLLVLFACTCQALRAEKVYDFNTRCQDAYHRIMQLRIDDGQRLLDEEKRSNPDNLIPYFLENYIDFLVLFFNEDPAEYDKRQGHRDERLALLEKGPANSPFYNFTRAIINFQWAAVDAKFGSTWSAGWAFRRSFMQIKESQKKYPAFTPNQMIYGAMQTVVGTVPDGYKWVSSMFGMKGTVSGGMNMLTVFLNKTDTLSTVFKDEAIFYYVYLKFYVLNQKEEVFTYIQQRKLDVVNNHLFTYMMANLALNNQRADITEAVIRNRNQSAGYMVTNVWDMEMGYARLDHLEKDANVYLERFIANFKGRFYVKDVLQKLSWYYYLQGNMAQATHYRELVLTKGSTASETDKNALRDAKAGFWPNKLLLQARLLNDGGYHKEALGVLAGKSSNDFAHVEEKLEFAYRLGRIYDDMGRDTDAENAYLAAIKLGEHRPEYFAARAALQLGYLYEQKNNKPMAAAFFQRCLNMKDHEFKNSLDQRAKAGLARCNGN